MTSRRSFITLLGGVAATWPMAARAQQPAMPVIGWLDSGGRPNSDSLTAFRKGLSHAGYVEGQNVATVFLGAEQSQQLPALAAELVRRGVAVIVAAGNANAALAAKASTSSIPIVFASGIDPVRNGLVVSINRPGGNVTGVSFYTHTLVPKRLELLRELVPHASTIGYVVNPSNINYAGDTAELQSAARSIGQQIAVLTASSADEIDAALTMAAQKRVDALLINTDVFFNRRRSQLAALTARFKIPANYGSRPYVEAGGLMSYGDDRRESYRQAALYVGRILKGEKPADMPVLQPTKFEFVINLKTAKALGITFPPSFHLRATEVIE